MNPGTAEEVGKATNAFMQIMKDQPLALALCVMNVLLLIIGWSFLSKVYEQRQLDMTALYQQNEKVQQLLYQCVPHSP